MRIKTDVDVFALVVPAMEVLALVRLIANGQHEWLATPDTADAATRYFENKLPDESQTLTLLAESSFQVAAAYSAPSVGRRAPSVTAATLSAFVADLSRSACLVVEDREADGAFLGSLFRIFGRSRLSQALERGWLEFVHAGGTGRVVSVARGAKQHFHHLERVVAVVDSDRMTPGVQSPNAHIASRLAPDGVHVHILELREAENYIPTKALTTIRVVRGQRRVLSEKLEALKGLTVDQRGHLDFKNGFRMGANGPEVPASQASLYASVSESDRVRLVGGFGSSALECVSTAEASLKPSDFATVAPNARAELEDLLNKIERAL
ncbi:hypothetical protein [Baekduia sp. Peel2402]|uniref:hypothetical protein n=1 Tax=Baekduia sp. Peel2402 TaxID=3458296 RepID=UPI00403E3ECD